ncbi:MAG: cell envelope integrity protein TolA [Rickettsiaceae bacterium]
MLNSVFVSVLLHICFFGLLFFVNFTKTPFFEQEDQVIIMDVVPISSISNVKTQNIKKNVSQSNATNARRNNQSKAQQKQNHAQQNNKSQVAAKNPVAPQKKIDPKKQTNSQVKSNQKKPDLAKNSSNTRKPTNLVQQKHKEPNKQQAATKPASANKPSHLVEKKKSVDTNNKVEDTALDSLLKNLEKSSQGENNKSKEIATTQSQDDVFSRGKYNDALPISQRERDIIERRISENWNIPVGVKGIEQIQITLFLQLKENGDIKNVELVDLICKDVSKSNCDMVANSAIRAVKKASHIDNLSLERYEYWKELYLNFNLQSVLNK